MTKRSLTDEESSDLPEKVSLPRRAPLAKKLKPTPARSDAVSYASDEDKKKAASTSGKRLSFGSFEPMEVEAPETPKLRQNPKPSEKALYMSNVDVVSLSDSSESAEKQKKKNKSKKPKSPSKNKQGHISESWDEIDDESDRKLSKNDRNAVPSGSPSKPSNSTPKEQALKSTPKDQGSTSKRRRDNAEDTPTKVPKGRDDAQHRRRDNDETLISKRNQQDEDDNSPPPKRDHGSRSRRRHYDDDNADEASWPRRRRRDDDNDDDSRPRRRRRDDDDDDYSPPQRERGSQSEHRRRDDDNSSPPTKEHGSGFEQRHDDDDGDSLSLKRDRDLKSRHRRRDDDSSPPQRSTFRDHGSRSERRHRDNDKGSLTSKVDQHRRHRNESPSPERLVIRDETPTPSDRRRREKLPSSRKGKQRARSLSHEEFPSSSKRKQRTRSLSPTPSQDVDDNMPPAGQAAPAEASASNPPSLPAVDYPGMPTICSSFTGFKHLAHTFTTVQNRSNLMSRNSFYRNLAPIDRGSFLSALNFTREGPLINPSRSRLSNVNPSKTGRFVFGRDDNALLLFNGVVACCSLMDPTSINGASVRCISVYPFKDDFAQWKNFIASVIQKTDIVTYTDNDVVSFLSKKENAPLEENGRSYGEPVSSPAKADRFFEDEVEPDAVPKFSLTRIPYAVPFNERIPIYDARGTDLRQFRLQQQYKDIGSLPLYTDGDGDLPQFSVVTVAHTASSFSYGTDKNMTGLQLNVIFVILHGLIDYETN